MEVKSVVFFRGFFAYLFLTSFLLVHSVLLPLFILHYLFFLAVFMERWYLGNFFVLRIFLLHTTYIYVFLIPIVLGGCHGLG